MTYEQSKYMNGDENANAPHPAPIPEPQTQGGNNLTYEQSKYNDEYQKRNNVAQEGVQTRQDQVLSKRPGDGSQDTKNGFADTMKKGWDTVKGWFNPQDKSSQTGDTKTYGKRETDLYNNVGQNTKDSMSNLEQTGATAKEKIENVMPKYSKQTWKNIMTSPEYSWDEKLELIMNGIGGALSAGDTGQVQQTNKKMLDDTITQQYAQNIADRDKRAMNAQIEPIEAANKQYTDLELRMRDTVAGSYIDRYKAAQDTETKQQILQQLIDDSDTWARLSVDKKIDLLSYIQALDGTGSLLGMAIQKYMPDLFNKFDEWVKSGKNPKDFEIKEALETGNTDFLKTPILTLGEGNSMSVYDIGMKYSKNPQALVDDIVANGLDPATTIADMKSSLEEAYKNDPYGEAQFAEYGAVLDALNKAQKLKPTPTSGNDQPITEGVSEGINTLQRQQNATDVQNKLNEIQYNVTSGKWSPERALAQIDALSEKANNMEDPSGILGARKQSLEKEYVTKDIEAYTGDPFISGEEKLARLDSMGKKHSERIANNPDLQKKMDSMLTQYRLQTSVVDPYMEKAGNELAGGVALGNDGKIYMRTKKGDKEMNLATVNWDKENDRKQAENIMQALFEKADVGTVQSNMPNVPSKELGTMFRETPVYKQMASIVKDKDMQTLATATDNNGKPKYPNMKAIYDNMDKRLKMWNNK